VTPPALTAARPSLYTPDGQWLTCPECAQRHPTWRFKRPFLRHPDYLEQTAEIVKCPRCGWTFAPTAPSTASK
jgi:hypothetical protein